jgi:hypothetical protein
MLFFLKRLAFVHQGFIGAARRGVGLESVNALADAAGLDLLKNGGAQFVRFRFNFCRHKFCRQNKAYSPAKSNCQGRLHRRRINGLMDEGIFGLVEKTCRSARPSLQKSTNPIIRFSVYPLPEITRKSGAIFGNGFDNAPSNR